MALFECRKYIPTQADADTSKVMHSLCLLRPDEKAMPVKVDSWKNNQAHFTLCS